MRQSTKYRTTSMLFAVATLALAGGPAVAASSTGFTTAPTDWMPRCHTVRICARWTPGSVGASDGCESWTTKRSCPGGVGK